MKAFLSHSSKDKSLVQNVYEGLRPNATWLDKAEIEWGQLFLEKITEGIESASDFVLFWSSAAKESAWVSLELNMAFIRMLNEKAIRLKVVLLDKTDLSLYLKPYHFLDVSGSVDPAGEILKQLVPALKEPQKAQRHRFLNRNKELDRIELAIIDSETFIICVTGFQGIGKSSLLDEAVKRFFKGGDSISIEVTGGTDLTELALKLNAHARQCDLKLGLSKALLEKELALSLEAIAKAGRFLILKNVRHWLDEDAKPISPLREFLSIVKTIPSFKDRPIFISSTRKLDIDIADSSGITQIHINGLEPMYIATLIRLWYEITEGREIPHEDSLVVAKELHGYPIAAKIAAGLIGRYGTKVLQESPGYLTNLRRDLARNLISEVKLSNETKLLMEVLSVARTSLPASVLGKVLGLTIKDLHSAINQASALTN